MRTLQKGGKRKTCVLGLRSHPVLRDDIYITSNYGQKRIFYIKLTVMSFFCRVNDLRKGFTVGMKERLHLKINISSSNKNEHIDRDAFVHLLICTLYLNFSQNFKGCVPWGSNKFASVALVLIMQKNTEILYLVHY